MDGCLSGHAEYLAGGVVWAPEFKSCLGVGEGVGPPQPIGVTEKGVGVTSPPAPHGGNIRSRKEIGSVFFFPTLQANVGENKFWLADPASSNLLKAGLFGPFVACLSGSCLPPKVSACIRAGLQKEFRSYVFV